MEVSATKRVRSSNWGEVEKRLLTQLVTERIQIIENKDNSTNTNTMKKAAWKEILSCFNCLSDKQRDLNQIMTQWRNTKGKVKSRESQYRRALMMTGGGPPPPSPPPEDLMIIEALPNEFVIDSNQFDSDSLYFKTLKQSSASGNAKTDNKVEVGGSKEVVEVLEESVQTQPESEKLTVTIPVATASHNKTYKKSRKLQKKKGPTDNYEEQLYILTKNSKERDCERAEEIHKKRLRIMDLEEQYWQKKFETLK